MSIVLAFDCLVRHLANVSGQLPEPISLSNLFLLDYDTGFATFRKYEALTSRYQIIIKLALVFVHLDIATAIYARSNVQQRSPIRL